MYKFIQHSAMLVVYVPMVMMLQELIKLIIAFNRTIVVVLFFCRTDGYIGQREQLY